MNIFSFLASVPVRAIACRATLLTTALFIAVASVAAGADDTLGRISTRGQIQTGDNILVSDVIVTGSEAKQVLLRLLGPSLGGSGVADPILELHDGQGSLLGSNDNWKVNDQTHQSQEAAIVATGEAPSQDAESAMLATLPPGNYAAIGRGKNGDWRS